MGHQLADEVSRLLSQINEQMAQWQQHSLVQEGYQYAYAVLQERLQQVEIFAKQLLPPLHSLQASYVPDELEATDSPLSTLATAGSPLPRNRRMCQLLVERLVADIWP